MSSNLSTLGYLAKDVTHQCQECGHHFACGEPVDAFDSDAVDVPDPSCRVCGATTHLYQMHEGVNGLALRFKCPECYYVRVVERELVDGALTIGYDEVLGAVDDERVTPYGYNQDVDQD